MTIPSWIWSLLAGVLLGSVLVGVGVFGALEPAPQWATSERTGDEAPNFALETLEGETFRLKDHRGEVVVLNFWATWCPPCRHEIPTLVTLQRELGDRGLQIVGVALERSAGPEQVRAFADEMGINYPIGLGDGSIAQKYGGVRSLPTTYIIAPDGTIEGHIPGMVTESMLRPGLEKLLKETSAGG